MKEKEMMDCHKDLKGAKEQLLKDIAVAAALGAIGAACTTVICLSGGEGFARMVAVEAAVGLVAATIASVCYVGYEASLVCDALLGRKWQGRNSE